MAEATNADDTQVADDNLDVSEEGLAAAKAEAAGVETSNEEDETPGTEENAGEESTEDAGENDGQTDDDTTEESSEEEEEPKFVKKFPQIKGDTFEDYAKNLEEAYDNSTAEYHRLRESQNQNEAAPSAGEESGEDRTSGTISPTDPLSLYAKQKMDEEIDIAYTDFRKDFPQVTDKSNYDAFTREVQVMSKTIMESQGRLASPKELYNKAAIALGWERQPTVDSKEKLTMALKDKSGSSKASGISKGAPKQPKISEAEIQANMKMYPAKTRQQIIKELTPYHS